MLAYRFQLIHPVQHRFSRPHIRITCLSQTATWFPRLFHMFREAAMLPARKDVIWCDALNDRHVRCKALHDNPHTFGTSDTTSMNILAIRGG